MNRYQVTIAVMSDSELTAARDAAKMLLTHPGFANVSQLPRYGYDFTTANKHKDTHTTEEAATKLPDEAKREMVSRAKAIVESSDGRQEEIKMLRGKLKMAALLLMAHHEISYQPPQGQTCPICDECYNDIFSDVVTFENKNKMDKFLENPTYPEL
jgi:hypothetical protein